MIRTVTTALIVAATATFGLFGMPGSGSTPQALAMGSAPAEKPKIDCRKRKNRKKAECRKPQSGQLNDDQIYQAGYWLAQAGKFEEALAQFRKAKNQDDPRILNYIGYTTRKLGRVDEALTYYNKALSLNPNYTMARAYLGEAMLEKGEIAFAKEQLAEIKKRCGTSCAEYVELAAQITSFETTGKFKPQGKSDAKLGNSG